MRSSFNLLFFANSMFAPFYMSKGYVLSGEIALRNNRYYYYYDPKIIFEKKTCPEFHFHVLLSAIIDSHSIIHHSFADDLQLQMSAPPDRISELLHSMQSCICDLKVWATANMLKLNDSKTELMLVTSKRSKHLHNLPTSITIGNAKIPFKQSEKFGFYIGLSSYYECTYLQYCSDMLL